MKNLKITAVYRDGGTIDYVDEDGNKYHKYQSMSKSDKKEGGKLYLGHLIDHIDPPELAVGEFRLEVKETRVIKQ